MVWCLLFIISSGSSAIINTKENIATFNLEISNEAKKALGFPEDAYLNLTDLAGKYGYPVEEHTIVTKDGFFSKLFRLGTNKGPSVLLMHGLTDSADSWVISGPKRSLAYNFVDAGYDIWIGEFRGSKYTRKHKYLNPNKDVKFWKWGLDEISQYDIPAMIEYILNSRKATSLSYIGHSMGCRLFYQMGTYQPNIFKKVDVMISLAPSPWTTNLFNPGLRQMSLLTNEIEAIFYYVGIQEIFGSHSLIGNTFIQILCSRVDSHNRSLNEKLCTFIYDNTFGPGSDQLTKEMLPIMFGHSYCVTSGQTLAHISQGLHSSKFQRYDRGFRGNMKAYGTPTPPEYDVSLVTTPVAIFSGRNDWLASIEDVETLIAKLPKLVEHYIVPREKWNHYDHMFGREAPVLVGRRILGILDRYTKGVNENT